jgi:hypothetical protein
MDVSVNNTRSDIRATAIGLRRPTHGTRPDLLPSAMFVAEVVARGLVHVARDQFRGMSDPAALTRCGTPILVRSDRDADEVEA